MDKPTNDEQTKVFELTMKKFQTYIELFSEDNLDESSNSAWYEGYCTALAAHGLITESQFDKLMAEVGMDTEGVENELVDCFAVELLKSCNKLH
jgi:hypothetical protein